MADQCTWPPSPDGSFWVSWAEYVDRRPILNVDRRGVAFEIRGFEPQTIDAIGMTQFGAAGHYRWMGDHWHCREWVDDGVHRPGSIGTCKLDPDHTGECSGDARRAVVSGRVRG